MEINTFQVTFEGRTYYWTITKEKSVTLCMCLSKGLGRICLFSFRTPSMQENTSQDTSGATTEGFNTLAVTNKTAVLPLYCVVPAHKGTRHKS